MGYFYIFGCIAFTVYGQLILKWRISHFGELPETISGKAVYLFTVLTDLVAFSGLAAALVAALFWVLAMTKFDISFAYPFMSLAFVSVFVLSVVLFQEPVNSFKVIGLMLIVAGIFVSNFSPEK